jgi:hypothetical protein
MAASSMRTKRACRLRRRRSHRFLVEAQPSRRARRKRCVRRDTPCEKNRYACLDVAPVRRHTPGADATGEVREFTYGSHTDKAPDRLSCDDRRMRSDLLKQIAEADQISSKI